MPSAVTTRPLPEASELPSGRPPRSRIGAIVLIAAIIAAILAGIVFIAIGEENASIQIDGAGETQRLFGGIRQDEARLGFADAPVRIEIFNDIQCTDCREWYLAAIPSLVEDRVRPGEVVLEYHHFSLGEKETNTGFFAVTAAGVQDRQWQYLHLFLLNQGEVPARGVDQDFLDAIAAGVLEFDDSDWRADIDAPEVVEEVEADAALAAELELPLDPAVIVEGPGGEEKLTGAPTLAEIEAAISAVG